MKVFWSFSLALMNHTILVNGAAEEDHVIRLKALGKIENGSLGETVSWKATTLNIFSLFKLIHDLRR